eukprot:TRINITY_DN5641_c0_g1_i2.p1 TRINITY_DN5641_c0_g1~~TRINITY_DN5641_c0_g1_i2.p1  ORF type:complete len:290 (+),score=32.30 TRINITY_DN5641_c0_g1_i2:158-1027(+)
MQRYKKLVVNERPDITLFILANDINILNSKKSNLLPQQHLDSSLLLTPTNILPSQNSLSTSLHQKTLLLKSFCPSLYEHYDAKLGLLLCSIGGIPRYQNNTRIRGQCHILLFGEPGTGKTTLLQFATQLVPRSVLTNAIGTSSCGLTVTVVKDGQGEWNVEAGAMVIADRGVCAIDEFNLMKKTEIQFILEAMEQQSISLAKAGITTKINARTSVFAACNPILQGQKYDPNLSLIENSGLDSTLISRFDLIFVLVDNVNSENDENNCDFILAREMDGSNHFEQDSQNDL